MLASIAQRDMYVVLEEIHVSHVMLSTSYLITNFIQFTGSGPSKVVINDSGDGRGRVGLNF